MANPQNAYLAAEARARLNIDRQLAAAGWAVQSRDELNLLASRSVAVREFVLEEGHSRVDYLPFVDRKPLGVIEANPEGKTLVAQEIVDDLRAAMEQFKLHAHTSTS